jgi:hypothetical protein
VSDTRQIFEGLRKVRRPEPMVLPSGKTLFVKGFNTFERMQFSDFVSAMGEAEVGPGERSFKIAAFAAYVGVVKESGERVFESVEDVVKVFGDIDDDGLAAVFDVAQEILARSGLAQKSAETAEKN